MQARILKVWCKWPHVNGLWRQEERDSGRERDENITPEGLVGFFHEKITVKSSLSLFLPIFVPFWV